MHIKDLIDELGKQLGISDLRLDENGVCRLIFDKKFTVDLEAAEEEKTLHMYTALCSIPQEERASLYDLFLEANLFGYGTGGAVFATDPETQEILLFKTFSMEKTDYTDFINELEKFVNQIEAWQERISRAASDTEADGKDVGRDPLQSGFIKA